MSQEVSEVLGYLSTHKGSSLLNGWVEKQPIDNRTISWIDNRRWRRKFMELHPHLIVWFQDAEAVVPRGYMMLTPATTVCRESPGKGSSIEVACSSGRTLRFRTRDAQSHHAWLSGVNRALARHEQPQQQPQLHRVTMGSSGSVHHTSSPVPAASPGGLHGPRRDDLLSARRSSYGANAADADVGRRAAGSRYQLRSLSQAPPPGEVDRVAARTRGQTALPYPSGGSSSSSSLMAHPAAGPPAGASRRGVESEQPWWNVLDSERNSSGDDSSEDEVIGQWLAKQRAQKPPPSGRRASQPTSHAGVGKAPSARPSARYAGAAEGGGATTSMDLPSKRQPRGSAKAVPGPPSTQSHLETAVNGTGATASGVTGRSAGAGAHPGSGLAKPSTPCEGRSPGKRPASEALKEPPPKNAPQLKMLRSWGESSLLAGLPEGNEPRGQGQASVSTAGPAPPPAMKPEEQKGDWDEDDDDESSSDDEEGNGKGKERPPARMLSRQSSCNSVTAVVL